MRKPNKARGEVGVTVGGRDIILCAEMARLEQMEQATGGQSLTEVFSDVRLLKLSTLKACLSALAIDGDADAAWSGMIGAGEMPKLQKAILAALVPDTEDASGNVEGAAASE